MTHSPAVTNGQFTLWARNTRLERGQRVQPVNVIVWSRDVAMGELPVTDDHYSLSIECEYVDTDTNGGLSLFKLIDSGGHTLMLISIGARVANRVMLEHTAVDYLIDRAGKL